MCCGAVKPVRNAFVTTVHLAAQCLWRGSDLLQPSWCSRGTIFTTELCDLPASLGCPLLVAFYGGGTLLRDRARGGRTAQYRRAAKVLIQRGILKPSVACTASWAAR